MQKQKIEKHFDADPVTAAVKIILEAYPEKFRAFSSQEVKCLFKKEKDKPNKKGVSVRIIREPMTLLTPFKLLIIVGDEWWQNQIDSDRTKLLIETLISVDTDKNGKLTKRDYDIKTFAEFIDPNGLDFSSFDKILPAEAKPEILELKA